MDRLTNGERQGILPYSARGLHMTYQSAFELGKRSFDNTKKHWTSMPKLEDQPASPKFIFTSPKHFPSPEQEDLPLGSKFLGGGG